MIGDPDASSLMVYPAGPEDVGYRLDRWLADRLADSSRHQIQLEIKAGSIRVNDRVEPNRYRLREGDHVEVRTRAPRVASPMLPWPVELSVVHEEEAFLVIEKPVGMVVHPAPGHQRGSGASPRLRHRPPGQPLHRRRHQPPRPGCRPGVKVEAATVWASPVSPAFLDYGGPYGRKSRRRV